MKTTKILVADAHALTMAGIKSILSRLESVDLVCECTHGKDLQNSVKVYKPDLIILDYDISGHFCFDDLELLRKKFPLTAVLVITTNNIKHDISRVLDLGISGYLLKECDEDEIISAINAIKASEKFFCGKVMDSILETTNHKCLPGSDCDQCMAVSLSNREIEIVKLIADGLTTKDIAKKIHLSFFTVATHRKNIFRKLQIRNSPELIQYALKEGIISHQYS
ncbi:MAG TPA: response regulator transcription factor [Bacteroidia bacterium]|nr:response regulator transcription factor [Bacteroidia bacterium]